MDRNPSLPETLAIQREYLMIDTTNPLGNELAAVRFLAEILDREQIPYALYEPTPGRANLVARLTHRPLMLLNHLDVVGVERARWSVDYWAT